MSFIIKLLVVAAMHVLLYAGYPDTGHYGNYVLVISFLVCCGLMLLLSIPVSILKFFLRGTLGMLLNLAVFIVMGAAIAYTMPQRDGSRVLDKIRNRSFPDAAAFRSGLRRLAAFNNEVKAGTMELGEKAKKAAETYENYRDNGRDRVRGRRAGKKPAR